MGQTSVFVSYSHQDDAWCRQMVAILRTVGYDVWHDETGFSGGDAWVATIQREIQTREVFLLILTPEAWASEWVQEEFQLAKITRRRIIAVLLRDTQADGFILTTQWVKVQGEEPQEATRAIILAIESAPAPGKSPAPQSAETLDDLVTLCQTLAADTRYTEALPACDRALALDPDNFDALRVKGSVLARIGQQSRAAAAFGQALAHLNLSDANRRSDDEVDELSEMSEYVFKFSDDPATIMQVYRQTMRPELMILWASRREKLSIYGQIDRRGRLTNMKIFTDFRPLAHFRDIVLRMSSMGAKDALVELMTECNAGGDERSHVYNTLGVGPEGEKVYDALARVGLIDLVLQLGVHSHWEGRALSALIGAGYTDDAMRRAPGLVGMGNRGWVIGALKEKGRYDLVDTLCRRWFGFPPPRKLFDFYLPPNSPFVTYIHGNEANAFGAVLADWALALDELGHQQDATSIRRFCSASGLHTQQAGQWQDWRG